MRVVAVNARHRTVAQTAVQRSHYSLRLVPGRYTIELRTSSGRKLAAHGVRARLRKTAEVDFSLSKICY